MTLSFSQPESFFSLSPILILFPIVCLTDSIYYAFSNISLLKGVWVLVSWFVSEMAVGTGEATVVVLGTD